MTAVLVAAGLHKAFGMTPALRGVGLTVDAGEVVAITGESGSGKSTLLMCLAGILQPDDGTVRYAGRDLAAMSNLERARLRSTEFGFVFQMGYLVPDLSAIDNVVLPLLLAGMRRSEAKVRALELLSRLSVDRLAERRPADMSGGEAQRVAIARALVTSPTVVFADEPTGSLDSRNAEMALRMLLEQVRERACSLVLVSHSEDVAARAERRLVMKDGMLNGSAS